MRAPRTCWLMLLEWHAVSMLATILIINAPSMPDKGTSRTSKG